MNYDSNPKFAKDKSFSEGARRVADLLWDSGANFSEFPQPYLENLRHEFANGEVSMLELIDRIDLGPEATYEEYCEVVESLMKVHPTQWPEPGSVLQVQSSKLNYEIEQDFSEFEEFDFAELPGDMSEKMETFLKKVIASVYLDGVTEVTDAQGNPPNEANNYLLSDDGKEFSGIFYDAGGPQTKKFNFSITEKSEGNWMIKY